MKESCSINDCQRIARARGWCTTHYKQWRRGNEHLSPPERNMTTRFWRKVHKTDACWQWTGYLGADGYGSIMDDSGRSIGAHRASFIIEHGPVPAGMVIDHLCYNRGCVRPSHLRAATNKQNMENRPGPNANSRSGILGVYWRPDCSKWQVVIHSQGVKHHVGYFRSVEDAEAAAKAKRNELYTHNMRDREPWPA